MIWGLGFNDDVWLWFDDYDLMMMFDYDLMIMSYDMMLCDLW
jgi:hypothetical protein